MYRERIAYLEREELTVVAREAIMLKILLKSTLELITSISHNLLPLIRTMTIPWRISFTLSPRKPPGSKLSNGNGP